MSSKFSENLLKAGSPFRTPATGLDQHNAYAIYDLTHPRSDAGGSGGSSGIGYLVLLAVVVPFALVAVVGAAIAALLIWMAQRLIPRVHADFDNAFVTAFFGMFALALCAFGVTLGINVVGAFWPAAADFAHVMDTEITRVVSGNPILSGLATSIMGNDLFDDFNADEALPLASILTARGVMYVPGVLAFGWLLARRVDFGMRGPLGFTAALVAAVALTFVSLPLAGYLMTLLTPYAAISPVFGADFMGWLPVIFLGAVGVVFTGAVLSALVASPIVRRLRIGSLPLWQGLLAGLLGFAAYVFVTLCVMTVFRQGDAMLAWADAVTEEPNAIAAALSSLPRLGAALGGYLLVQLPGALVLGRILGGAAYRADGFTRYAASCLVAQILALVVVPVGLLAGLMLFNVVAAAMGY